MAFIASFGAMMTQAARFGENDFPCGSNPQFPRTPACSTRIALIREPHPGHAATGRDRRSVMVE
jgi:hypothetical protein